MNSYIKVPIGLEPVVSKVEEICSHADAFRRCGITPNHFLINLDKGNGQTTVTSYISDAFFAGGVRHFGGLDRFLEYSLNGSVAQFRQIVNDIRSCAVYTNEYEGVIAMDLSELASHIHESQISLFLKELSVIGKHATFVFYVPSVISKNMTTLIEMLCSAIDRIDIIQVSPYSAQDLTEIIKSAIDEAGVDLVSGQETDTCILNIVRYAGAANLKDAKQLARIMLQNADFDSFTPSLTPELINKAFHITDTKKEVK